MKSNCGDTTVIRYFYLHNGESYVSKTIDSFFYWYPEYFLFLISPYHTTTWVCCQIRKITVCACAGNTENVFPAADFKGNSYLVIPACITARAVMHVGIANPQCRGKRSRHFRRMRDHNFTYMFARASQYYPKSSNLPLTNMGPIVI